MRGLDVKQAEPADAGVLHADCERLLLVLHLRGALYLVFRVLNFWILKMESRIFEVRRISFFEF